MFWNVAKGAWRINPRLVSRAMSVLVQYWHYYDFARRENWQKAGLADTPDVKILPDRGLA
jgi:hypothetical protein